MLNEKIVTFDYDKMAEAVKNCEPPVVIMMSIETMMGLAEEADENPDVDVTENEYDRIVTYKNIPIVASPFMPFGYILIK